MNVEEQIKDILTRELSPVLLEVVNESHLHAGHAGDDGSGESHFSVKVVSDAFAGMSRLQCHRMIYDLLGNGLEKSVHALSIQASAPEG